MDDLVYLKGKVHPLQSVNDAFHSSWLICKKDGTILTAGCSCVAGLGKCCSNAGALLWKVEYVVKNHLTGISCTDEQATWNRGTTRNVTPSAIVNIPVKKPKEIPLLETVIILQLMHHLRKLNHAMISQQQQKIQMSKNYSTSPTQQLEFVSGKMLLHIKQETVEKVTVPYALPFTISTIS